MLFRTRYNVLFRQFRLLTAQAGSIPAAIRLIFENCYKRIFLCFSHLRLRRRFHLSAELHALQGRNTSCEAASRRNEKKAFSAAASFFPFRQLLRGLKGASSPFLVDPARRNRWCFSGSLLARKRELSPTATAIYPAPQAREAVHKTPHSRKAPQWGAFCSIIFCESDSSAAGSASRRRPPS